MDIGHDCEQHFRRVKYLGDTMWLVVCEICAEYLSWGSAGMPEHGFELCGPRCCDLPSTWVDAMPAPRGRVELRRGDKRLVRGETEPINLSECWECIYEGGCEDGIAAELAWWEWQVEMRAWLAQRPRGVRVRYELYSPCGWGRAHTEG